MNQMKQETDLSSNNMYHYGKQQLSSDETNYGSKSQHPINYGDHQVLRQPTFSNYPQQHFHQTEQHLINQPVVYSTSAPNYNQAHHSDPSKLGTSPVYSHQLIDSTSTSLNQPNLDSLITNQSHTQTYAINTSTSKVIEMPVLQSSMNLNEGLYQQLQQQKTFTTSTAYPMGSTKYPWPSPKLN